MSKSLAIKLSERELITVDENDQLLEAIKILVKYKSIRTLLSSKIVLFLSSN